MYYFCTYFDKNYYPRSRALHESLVRCGVDFTLFALCLDEESAQLVDALGLPSFVPVPVAELEAHDPELKSVKSGRSKVEYYFTCTAAFCSFVMERFRQVDLLTYLDADLYFFAHPKPLFDEMEDSSIGIIPHRYSLIASIHKAHGLYNVGWVSFRRDAEGLACLDLWRRQCIEWCYDRVEDGKFADQKYLDAWPGRFARVRVIEHTGANIGSWNIARYPVRVSSDGRLMAGDAPLIFFHFACFSQLSKRIFNTSFGGNYVYLTPTVRRHVYGPYIEDLLRFSADDGLARRDRKADSHIQRIRQLIRLALRTVRGIVFNEYIVLPRAEMGQRVAISMKEE
ncbi:MAG: hypothetical protein ACM3Q4_05930 [Acidobacteriota bacterium]